MKREDLNDTEKMIVDEYFDINHLNATIAETQALIDSGMSLGALAKHYGTDVQDWDNDEYFIDINTDRYMYSVFNSKDCGTFIGSMVDVWTDYMGAPVFEYDRINGEFYHFYEE